jgi:CheY-like chemotaxis protein
MGQAFRPTVLVVEDDPDVRSLAAAVIEEIDVEVVGLETAEEALSYLRRHGGDVAAIFIDIRLPGGMDGVDLARAVHVRWPQVAVIVTSGDPGDRLELMPAGARYLQKPWRALDVMMAVDKAASLRS